MSLAPASWLSFTGNWELKSPKNIPLGVAIYKAIGLSKSYSTIPIKGPKYFVDIL